MNRLTCLSAIALLAAGCGRGAIPAATPGALPAQPAQHAETPSRIVELRHFYLLTPGPNAKLVVTSSDVVDVADAPQ